MNVKGLKNSLVVIFLLFFSSMFAQTFTDSNLPIVIISTDIDLNTGLPLDILDNPDVSGNMKIIKRPEGERNFISDQNTQEFLNYDGRIKIQIRGSSSQVLDKKGYKLTTVQADDIANNNVSLLDMPSENDWVLNGLAFDPSLIRDYLAYNLSRQMGNYSPRTQYCELVINGDYRGLYLLQEKIKVDSNRVNILKITPSDNFGENLSGGYITKADKTTGDDPIAWTTFPYNGDYVNYIHDFPSPENITFQQNNFIYNYFMDFQEAIANNNSSLLNGYTNYIDVPSFIDFMISNEFAANVDGYQLSTYFHKDRNGKLRAGPIWDFNLTLGNDLFFWGFDRSKFNTWQFSNYDNEGSRFWTDLFNNSTFRCYLSKRFNRLIQVNQPLNINGIYTFIDSTVNSISEAIDRENQRWNSAPNHSFEINNLKDFIAYRVDWMSHSLGSFSSCSNVVLPPLVITKINYHPEETLTFPDSNSQEFIEITNTASTTINLSGIYLSKLGITYRFPYNSTIAGNSSIFIASNVSTFQSRYGFAPFGQFTRNLSNKSQKIELSDAFGNVIDYVEYQDVSPWPTSPDGNGSFLQLIDTSLDNSLASSWVASSETLNIKNQFNNQSFTIFPNPAADVLNINSNLNIHKVEIFNALGKMIGNQYQINSTLASIEISDFELGIYFLKIYTQQGVKIEKWIKK